MPLPFLIVAWALGLRPRVVPWLGEPVPST
jgi:hypothetical protein